MINCFQFRFNLAFNFNFCRYSLVGVHRAQIEADGLYRAVQLSW